MPHAHLRKPISVKLLTADKRFLSPWPLVIAILLFLAIPVPALSGDDSGKIQKYLRSLNVIRVLVDDTYNQGHQMPSIHLMARLRQLGFRGLYEVVTTSSNENTLAVLLPGFHPGQKEYTAPKIGHLRFVVVDRLPDLRFKTSVPLAITGGFDGHHGILPFMKADFFLQLQPLNWRFPHFILTPTKWISLDHLRGLGIQTSPHMEANIETFFHEELASYPSGEERANGLRELFTRQGEIELLPVYGLQRSPNVPATLGTLIKGLQGANQIEPGFWKKPIVVPVIGQAYGMEHGLDYWKVPHLDIQDPKLPQVIGRMTAGEILFVKIGFVPPDIFSYIYSRETLPGILEGKNTAALLRDMNLPFIHLLGSTQELELRSEIIQSHRAEIDIITRAFALFDRGGPDWNSSMNQKQKEIFYRFLKELRNPESFISTRFHNKTPGPDKVELALEILVDSIEARDQKAKVCERLVEEI